MKLYFNNLVHFFLPNRCHLCGRAYPHGPLCSLCQISSCWFSPVSTAGRCERCFQPLLLERGCASCSLSPPPYVRHQYLLNYLGRARELIRCMKYRPSSSVAKLLGRYAAVNFNLPAPGENLLIVPMPASPESSKIRGFNQSEVIAAEIASCWYKRPLLPVEKITLRLKTNARPQTALGKQARLKNRKNAFIVDRKIMNGEKVLLIDDVISTGASAVGATNALLKAGAKEVFFACLARNPTHLD